MATTAKDRDMYLFRAPTETPTATRETTRSARAQATLWERSVSGMSVHPRVAIRSQSHVLSLTQRSRRTRKSLRRSLHRSLCLYPLLLLWLQRMHPSLPHQLLWLQPRRLLHPHQLPWLQRKLRSRPLRLQWLRRKLPLRLPWQHQRPHQSLQQRHLWHLWHLCPPP